MKKLLLSLVLGGISAIALAQTPPAASNVIVVGAHVLRPGATTACPDMSGPTFNGQEVDISILNPTNVAGAQFRLLYDPTVATVIDPSDPAHPEFACAGGVENTGSVISGASAVVNYETGTAPDKNGLKGINVAIAGTKGTTRSGKLIQVYFQAKGAPGSSTAFTLDPGTDFVLASADSTAPPLTGSVTPGAIIIGSSTAGWSAVIPSGIAGSVTAFGGSVWVVGNDGILRAYDSAAGTPTAGFTSANVGGPVQGRPVVKEGAVFVATSNGKVARVDPATGKISATGDLSGGSATFVIHSTPAVANGQVYVTDGTDTLHSLDMTSLDVTKGKTIAVSTGKMAGLGASSPATFGPTAATTIWVGGADNAVHEFGADLTPMKTVATGGPVESSPFINAGGTGFVGSDDGKVYVFDAGTGAAIGNFDTKASVQNSPYGVGSQAVVVNSKGNLVVVNAAGGTVSGSSPGNVTFSGGAANGQSPIVVGSPGVIWVGDINGVLHASDLGGSTTSQKNIKVSGTPLTSPSFIPANTTAAIAAQDGSVVVLPTQ